MFDIIFAVATYQSYQKLNELSQINAFATICVQGVASLCVLRDGNTIASGSSNGVIRIWDIRTGILCNTLYGHTKVVASNTQLIVLTIIIS